jgi:hypothetical protein
MNIRAVLTSAVLLAPALAIAQQPMPVGKLSIAVSTSLDEVDIDRMKGQPAKLAWSPDGKELYLQAIEGDLAKPGAARHYVYTLADGKQTSVDAEPAWASAYWAKKRDRSMPGDESFAIDVVSVPQTARAGSAPMGGDLARGGTGGGGDIGGGGGGTTVGEAVAAAANTQSVMVNTLRLGGETIGEFVNMVPVPGLTFGWGPAGSGVIVFAQPRGGKLVIMDKAKKKQDVPGTKDAILPAFSDDGKKLAWLRKDGRKKFLLLVADVTAR